MSQRLLIFLICAILLAGCSPAIAPTPPTSLFPTLAPTPTPASTPAPAYPDLAVSKRRGIMGWGWYEFLVIDDGGNAAHEQSCSYWYPKREEWKTAKIAPEQIEELVAAINKANIWDMENQPNCPMTDCVPDAVSIALSGRSRTVTRYDAMLPVCPVTPPGATPGPGAALCELEHTIDRIANSVEWVIQTSSPTPAPTFTPLLSSAKVTVTVYMDQNDNGTPEPGEVQNGIPAELRLPDGNVLSATTQQGITTFDLSGYPAGLQITALLPNLYRSYQFYLPQSRTVPVVFSFAQPTVPTRSPQRSEGPSSNTTHTRCVGEGAALLPARMTSVCKVAAEAGMQAFNAPANIGEWRTGA